MDDSADEHDRRPLAYYESVPYLLVIESVDRGGEWLRRAEHPELPGCVAEAPSALDKLERERLRVLRQLGDRGASIPVPQPPLRDLVASRPRSTA
jgi:hypothetical protein